MSGLVSLVGAGPGDPDLLTRRAAQRLAEADLVLYDALVDPAVLELAGKAQRFYVGKRAGRHHVTQEQIHRILIRAAQRGQRVVRLKGGDPFVFGRGGEEALALAEAGIAFEVVPGISSSVAAPALAGIPVTHRGMSTGFVVVSGHANEAWQPALDSLAPGAVTVVVLMGLAHRGPIAARLLERGWSAQTPAAIVWAASRAEGSTWRGTLAELAAAAPSTESADSPGTIVVGAVVSLAEALAPAASHPITAAGGSR
jgi:uroporphyrin-III C-methyltransferase / precorrin-2 dehydrogenase / sirohydrochlorin ferrochelatase